MISNDDSSKIWPMLNPVHVGIRGRCPRCGTGKLFEGFLKLRSGCEHCGLPYAFADPADGPAFFILCFGCLPAFAFAIYLEVRFAPPLWVHLFTSLPLVLLTCIPPLRPLKGWLVAAQYHYRAQEAGVGNLATSDGVNPETDPPA